MNSPYPCDTPEQISRIILEDHARRAVEDLLSTPLPKSLVLGTLQTLSGTDGPGLTCPLAFSSREHALRFSRPGPSILEMASTHTLARIRSSETLQGFKTHPPSALQIICDMLSPAEKPHLHRALRKACALRAYANLPILMGSGASLCALLPGETPVDSALCTLVAGRSVDGSQLYYDYASDEADTHRVPALRSGLDELSGLIDSGRADPSLWIPALFAAVLSGHIDARRGDDQARDIVPILSEWHERRGDVIDWTRPVELEIQNEIHGSIYHVCTANHWRGPASFPCMLAMMPDIAAELAPLSPQVALCLHLPDPMRAHARACLLLDQPDFDPHARDAQNPDSLAAHRKAISKAFESALPSSLSHPDCALAYPPSYSDEQFARYFEEEVDAPRIQPGWGAAVARALTAYLDPDKFNPTATAYKDAASRIERLNAHPAGAHWKAFAADFGREARLALFDGTSLDLNTDAAPEQTVAGRLPFLNEVAAKLPHGESLAQAILSDALAIADSLATERARQHDGMISDAMDDLAALARLGALHPGEKKNAAAFATRCAKMFKKAAKHIGKIEAEKACALFEASLFEASLPNAKSSKSATRI